MAERMVLALFCTPAGTPVPGKLRQVACHHGGSPVWQPNLRYKLSCQSHLATKQLVVTGSTGSLMKCHEGVLDELATHLVSMRGVLDLDVIRGTFYQKVSKGLEQSALL